MGGLPKFLLPTPTGTLIGDLYHKMTNAGARDILVLTVRDYDEITDHAIGTFSIVVETDTMSQTVLKARGFTDYHESNVLFGMPDTYFEADYSELLRALDEHDAIVTAGCFRIRPDQWGKLGSVHVNAEKFIDGVFDKANGPGLYAFFWGIMAWRPAFWKYIQPEQPHVGYALQAAIDDGQRVPAVLFDGDYYDCGTRDEYFRLCAKWHKESEAVTA